MSYGKSYQSCDFEWYKYKYLFDDMNYSIQKYDKNIILFILHFFT